MGTWTLRECMQTGPTLLRGQLGAPGQTEDIPSSSYDSSYRFGYPVHLEKCRAYPTGRIRIQTRSVPRLLFRPNQVIKGSVHRVPKCVPGKCKAAADLIETNWARRAPFKAPRWPSRKPESLSEVLQYVQELQLVCVNKVA